MVVGLDDADGERGERQSQGGAGGEGERAAVQADAIRLGGPGLGAQLDHRLVVDHQWSHRQRVGGDGRDHPVGGRRLDDGSAHREVVTGATRGGGNDQPVSHIGGQGMLVDMGVDGDHRGGVVLEYGHFVEGVGPGVDGSTGNLDGEERAALDAATVVDHLFYHVESFLHRHGGEIAEMAGVDSEDGYPFVGHPTGGAQEGAVAPDAQGQRCREIVAVNHIIDNRRLAERAA